MPLSYVDALMVAEAIRHNLPHWKLRDGVEHAAAIAALEADGDFDDIAEAIGGTFRAYRIDGVLDG